MQPTADIIDSSDTGVSNNDNITSDNTPTIRGVTENGAIVTITDKDGNVVGSTIADENGNYSITTSELPDGTQDLKITATDKAGNSGTETQTITVDTAASDTDKLEITDIVDANGDYSYVTMKGTGAEAGNTISIYDEDGIKVATTTVQEDGTWSADISNFAGTPVNDNEFFKATETDLAGNETAQTDSTHYWHGDFAGAINTESTDDFVMAGAGNDTINTDATLSGTNENGNVTSDNDDTNDKVVIDGGDGNDTVTFGKDSSEYTITKDANGNIIVTESSASDSDGDGVGDVTELRNVENIKFADGVYDVDTGTFTSNDINAIVTLDATSSLTEAGGVITYTASVDVAPKTDMTITLDNNNTITIKANETVGTTTVNVDSSTYEDVYNDSSSIDASITGVSGGDYTSVDYTSTGSATTSITDTIDETSVSITGTITRPSTIDATNVEGEPNGINVYGVDLNGNKSDLSVVSGTDHDGFGVKGVTSGSGNSLELGYGNNGQSEKIVVDFDTDVKSLDVAFAWRNNSESAKVTFLDDDGKVVGSAMVSGGGNHNEALVTYYDEDGKVTKIETTQGGSDQVDLSYKFEPGNGETFSKVEFSAPGYNDDYLINKITYKEVVSSDVTDITKSNGEVTLEIQTSNPPQEGTTATAIVEVDGKEYQVQLDVNGRGTLNVEANGNTDLTATVKEIVGGNFESVNVSDSSWNLADEIISLNDNITVTEDQPYSLNVSDFGDKQINVSEVKITELPANGKLYINDGSIVETIVDNEGKEVNVYSNRHEVTAGTVISMVDIAAGKVVFIPDANSDENGSFKFQVDDGNGHFVDNIHTTTIDLVAVADAPTLDMSISDAVVNNNNTSNAFDDVSVHTDGGTNLDHSYYSGYTHSDQDLKIDNMNAHSIYTSEGNDTVSVKYSINSKFIDLNGGDDSMVIGGSTDNSIINMGSGNDKLQIDGNIGSHIYLGSGDDEIQLSSDSEVNFNSCAKVDGGSGEDTLFFTGSSNSYVLQDHHGNNISFDDYNAGNFPTHHIYNIYEVDGNGNTQGNPLEIEHIENIVFEADITPPAENTYDYTLDLNAQLTDTDGSESLSDITLTNIPEGSSLKDSSGNEISANDDGSYTISPDENGNATVTLESHAELESTQLDGIKASVTSTESDGGSQSTVEASENMFTISEDSPTGGDTVDTVTYEQNSVLDFDSLSAQNIEKINIEGNNQLDSATLDVDDVIKLTDDDNILTIIGDKGDEIGLSDDPSSLTDLTDGHSDDSGTDHTSGWEKSDTQVQDGDDTFDVWTNNDATVYIDTDITVTDI
ncbi:Hemolysin-type calcium-binding region [Arcobacter nitrofigilis DSM 7299]|uniref:Hemolysin-type calcium-binding region n=1 Tax=Arcobacter nitrofigilis (strain ATCC 33309 / DSM 7299 / CCUG 15893 / LMG 7604 / NCTC 12251 / CI) TaxID=572480 RepID=D5V5X5_ARCNC|nr:immunoglobulin-like domain-containing protein [Arcobacter nitrofigilis]ADG93142.1 Hemolysin-type calcium-binding region [Arcobacter nitrofigilis DSM 7299]